MDRCTSLFQSRIHGQNRQWGASSSCIHHTLAEINLSHAVEIDFTPRDGTLPCRSYSAATVLQRFNVLDHSRRFIRDRFHNALKLLPENQRPETSRPC